MRKGILVAVIVILAFVGGALVAASSGLTLVVNGEKVTNVEAKLIDGSTYVPLRAVSEMLGAKVGYDSATKTVSVTMDAAATPPVAEVVDGEGVYTVRDFKFYDLTIEEGMFGWVGNVEVENVGNNDYSGVIFSVTFYDVDGKRVGTVNGTFSDIRVGEVKTSTLIIRDALGEYSTVKFQIDASY